MDAALRALVALEQEQVHYDMPAPPGNSGLAVLPGRRAVLISAPHAVRHWRRDSWKREDEYTAAIACWLHRQTGAYALYPTHRIDPDPHADGDRGAYKRAVRDLIGAGAIRLVVDLHGARGDRDFAVALGTIRGESCPSYEGKIAAAFEAMGFRQGADAASGLDRLALNPPHYTGGVSDPTITRFAWRELGVPAVQVELNAWVRIVQRLPSASEAQRGIAPHFRGDPERIHRVLAALAQIVEYF